VSEATVSGCRTCRHPPCRSLATTLFRLNKFFFIGALNAHAPGFVPFLLELPESLFKRLPSENLGDALTRRQFAETTKGDSDQDPFCNS
jgi:hypothetical protein